MSPATELAHFLEASAVGVFGGDSEATWSINVAREPVQPVNAVTLYDTGGGDPIQIDIGLRAPTIQVRVRSADYEAAMAKQEEIRTLLADPTHRQIGDSHYVGIWLQGDILAIGRDDHDRHLLTANYRINRQTLGVLS